MKVGFLKPVLCSIFLGTVWATASTIPALANEAETYKSNEVVAGSMSVPFVTTANLRLRTRPCIREGSIQTVISRGRTVQVTDFRDGEWYAVEVDGVSGYMHSGYLVESNRTYEAPAAYEPISAVEEDTEPSWYVTTVEVVNTGPTWYVTTMQEVTTGPSRNVTTMEETAVSNMTTVEEVEEPAWNATTMEEVTEPARSETTMEVNTGPAWNITTMEEFITGAAWNVTTEDEDTESDSDVTTEEDTESAQDTEIAQYATTIEENTEPVWYATTVEEVAEPAWYATTVEEVNEPAWFATTIEEVTEPAWFATTEEFTEPVWYTTAEEVTEPVSYVTTANLMFRSEPCADAGYVQEVVPIGMTVQVTDFRCGEWYEVEMNGASGYMHSSFLVNENEWVNEYELYEPAPVTSARIERIYWSEARNILPTWEPVTITDVRTGISFQIISFSHGNHADIEPATAEDTATLLNIYGGAWSWNTRPVLVHVGDRTLAASINGMPHSVSPVQGNNFNGHICLYFYGSSRHTGSLQHDRDHHNSIWEAYNSGN